MKTSIITLAICAFAIAAEAQTADDALKAARLTNDYFMAKHQDPTEPTNVKKIRPSNLWTRGVYYEGLMALYDIDPDKRYIEYTDTWAHFHKWTPRNGVKTRDADDQCCEQTYIMRFRQTGDSAMIRPTLENINGQMNEGRTDYWTWIDAIQMAMPVYAMLSNTTGETKYIDHGMKLYRWSRNECGGGLFNKTDGLWWRDKDFVPPYKESDGNQCYWSRGDGWVYAALVRCMSEMKKGNPYYKELRADFLAMTTAIVNCQREDGFWNVSLVSPATFGGKETSGTALFLYGLCWGMNNKLLKKKTYLPIAQKACSAIINEALHRDGFIGYLQGTGKEPKDGQPVTLNSVPDFEDYGTGCVLLGLTEYYKLMK